MRVRNAIVVRRTQKLGGYREGDRGEALVLDQVGVGPPDMTFAALGSAAGVVAGASSVLALPSGVAAVAAIVGTLAGSAVGALVDLRRRRSVAKVRLAVADRELRVFRPGDAADPTDRVAIRDLVRVELVPLDLEESGWTLVALRTDGARVALLETGDRVAGLRVRTLILDRLVRDGAFEGEELASTPCPGCRARIVAPERWLPTSIACGACGAEGTLARSA